VAVKPRILIADDEPLTMELVAERLQAEGYTSSRIERRRSLAARAGDQLQNPPDRPSMPGVSGMEVWRISAEIIPKRLLSSLPLRLD